MKHSRSLEGGKEEKRHWVHLACAEARHFKMPAGYTVVTDWLTRVISVPWRSETSSASFVMQEEEKKKKHNRKEATKKDTQRLQLSGFLTVFLQDNKVYCTMVFFTF